MSDIDVCSMHSRIGPLPYSILHILLRELCKVFPHREHGVVIRSKGECGDSGRLVGISKVDFLIDYEVEPIVRDCRTPWSA